MGRAHNKGVTYDARTGFQARGKQLRQDGERRGLWTTDVDELHPQRFVRPPGPDGVNWRPGIPAPHGIPVRVTVSGPAVSAVGEASFEVETT